jgi:hypothetical protein
MTLAELESTLPNGLHDAELHGYTVDYAQQKLVLELTVWVGTMEDTLGSREAYRKGRVEISGLLFLALEASAADYPYGKSGPLTIDACDDQESGPNIVEVSSERCVLAKHLDKRMERFHAHRCEKCRDGVARRNISAHRIEGHELNG